MTDKPEIMTVQEVAEFLRVSERTIYDWATSETIPCGKLGTTWRFKRSEIEKWVNHHLSSSPKKNISFTPVKIKDILSPDNVTILQSQSKDEAIMAMVDMLAENGTISDRTSIAEGLFQREKLMSTGIGLGVGIPHLRTTEIDKITMAVGLGREDIADYDSIDGQPVRLMFMILAGVNQHAMHIKTMAAISRRIKNPILREMILQADSAEAIYNLLTGHGE